MLKDAYIKVVVLLSLVMFSDASINFGRRKKLGRLRVPPQQSSDVSMPDDYWFTQPLDHSKPTDTRTWQQRYRVVDDHYKEGGPVFIQIEGESEADAESLVFSPFMDVANNYNALFFQLEHRYYGESRPTSDLSVENLRYLTSEQALADVAYFIVGMNRQHKLPPDTKWVAFGGSYAGNLAAWVRYKYPHLVHAAVSSSAPVLAQVDFPEFHDVVEASLGTYSSQCVQAVQDANKEVNNLLETEQGCKTITDEFKLCDCIDSNNRNDVANLFSLLAENVAEAVQYNMAGFPNIDELCTIMLNQTLGTPVIRYAAVNNMFLNYYENQCLDCKYDNHINNMKNISYNNARPWTYQTCTEFGYYQSSGSKAALFGECFPVDFSIQQCSDIFGKEFTKELIYQAVDRTNMLYGGLGIKATRVVYVHGSIDPWHALGITKTRIPESPVIFIKGIAHCANMYSPNESDSSALTVAREEISSIIGKWLK